jgi:L-arabinokinase
VAAADVVVTKPGFGIIAECISTGTAMLYTSRGSFREYDVLVNALPRYVRARFIDQPALFAGRWRESLEALLEQPDPPERMALDGAEIAAGEILELLET